MLESVKNGETRVGVGDSGHAPGLVVRPKMACVISDANRQRTRVEQQNT